MQKKEIESIEKENNIDGLDNCHICISHNSDKCSGYPNLSRDGKSTTVVRYLYEQKHGKLPEGSIIALSCGNSKCININHATVSNRKDVAISTVVTNTRRGQKLTPDEVRDIMRSTATNIDLASKYKVSKYCISKIRNGHRWKHLFE